MLSPVLIAPVPAWTIICSESILFHERWKLVVKVERECNLHLRSYINAAYGKDGSNGS